MSFEVRSIDVFERQARRLSKKYPSLKGELVALVAELSDDPKLGTPLGNNCYKVRLSIASKGKGKSGGARVITNLVVRERTVYLLTIFDKSEQENLTAKELARLVDRVPR